MEPETSKYLIVLLKGKWRKRDSVISSSLRWVRSHGSAFQGSLPGRYCKADIKCVTSDTGNGVL